MPNVRPLHLVVLCSVVVSCVGVLETHRGPVHSRRSDHPAPPPPVVHHPPPSPHPAPAPMPAAMSYDEAVSLGSQYAQSRGYAFDLKNAHQTGDNVWKLKFDVERGNARGKLFLEYDAFSRNLIKVDDNVKEHGNKHDDDHDKKKRPGHGKGKGKGHKD